MPPKAKFTKAEIIEAALNIVRTDGYEALTSRALGTYLASSARPIFTVFKNMEEVQQAMIEAAKTLYKEYVNKGLAAAHPFKGVGTQYILFSVNESKLFQLLFMTEQKQIPDLSGVLLLIDESYEQILLSIQDDYKICKASSFERLIMSFRNSATLAEIAGISPSSRVETFAIWFSNSMDFLTGPA